jgi:hypothetical protein
MEVFTKELGTPTKSLIMESIRGTTVGLTKATGLTTICMAKESTNGRMEENTRVTT